MKWTRLRYAPNRYGAYHLTGNALEWTRSVFIPYNREKPYEDGPRNARAASGRRVARGGSWYSASNAYLLNSYRDAFQPEHSSQELGFRVVAKQLP
jgi:formylglycine-generating enzyme required for sulfatase activity